MSSARGGGELRSAILRTFPQFRNLSQFSATFRNFSAIFPTSRFSDCLPKLVQNNEKKIFYYAFMFACLLFLTVWDSSKAAAGTG